MTLSIGQWSSL